MKGKQRRRRMKKKKMRKIQRVTPGDVPVFLLLLQATADGPLLPGLVLEKKRRTRAGGDGRRQR